MMGIPKYAELVTTDNLSINYLCNIRDNKEYNIKYFETRKTVVLRNCDPTGNLCDLTLPKSCYSRLQPWVRLSVSQFTDKVLWEFLVYVYC
jgi:hypothetical protein